MVSIVILKLAALQGVSIPCVRYVRTSSFTLTNKLAALQDLLLTGPC